MSKANYEEVRICKYQDRLISKKRVNSSKLLSPLKKYGLVYLSKVSILQWRQCFKNLVGMIGR